MQLTMISILKQLASTFRELKQKTQPITGTYQMLNYILKKGNSKEQTIINGHISGPWWLAIQATNLEICHDYFMNRPYLQRWLTETVI
jgi:hypothetical protein